jgi:hypothetical protein
METSCWAWFSRNVRLNRRFAAADHVFAHAALTDVDAEFEQFAMDAGCTPTWILPAHLAEQISDLARNDRSSGLAVPPYLPGPEQPKAGTMPGNDRFWLDDGQRRAPVASEAAQTDPQQAVPRGQFRAFSGGPLKHADLVAQSQVLEPESSTRTADQGQSCEECRERNSHRREL